MSYAITFSHFQYDKEAMKIGNEKNFDTLKYANSLKTVGVPEKQAEAQAKTIAQVTEDKLATKTLELVKSELKHDIKELELNMGLKIESSNNITLRWLSSMIAASVIITIVALCFLIKLQ
jgi:hypothetical protein